MTMSRHGTDIYHKQSVGLIGGNKRVKNNGEISIFTYLTQYENTFFPASTIIRDAPLVKDTKDKIVKLKDLGIAPNNQVVSNMLSKLANKGTAITFWWEKRMVLLHEEAATAEKRKRTQRNIDKYLEAYPWRKPHFCSDQRWLVVSLKEKNTTSFTLKLITEETDNGREH